MTSPATAPVPLAANDDVVRCGERPCYLTCPIARLGEACVTVAGYFEALSTRAMNSSNDIPNN